MLNKLKIALIVGAVIQLIRAFMPDVVLPEGITEIIVDFIWLVIMLVGVGGAGYGWPESKAKVDKLELVK